MPQLNCKLHQDKLEESLKSVGKEDSYYVESEHRRY